MAEGGGDYAKRDHCGYGTFAERNPIVVCDYCARLGGTKGGNCEGCGAPLGRRARTEARPNEPAGVPA